MSEISVIIPVHDCFDKIDALMLSLFRQSVRNIEIICVDNNSTDNSLKILKKYAQKDPRIIISHEEKQGVSSTRNKGEKLLQSQK